MEKIFLEITIVIGLASICTIVFRALKQPAVLAYILTGILLGPLGFFHLQEKEALMTLSQLGITLLLFILGLELRLTELRSIGKSAVVAGILQMVVTFGLGFFIAILFGFNQAVALIVGVALSFSSTVIIVKLLSDKRDLNSLHGKIAIGILLVQDFFAILAIIFLARSGDISGPGMVWTIAAILLKMTVLFGWILLLSEFVFPKIIHRIAKSSESLFLFSLAWVFFLTAIVTWPPIGFSVEIGGFLAGLALAGSTENFHIVAKMRSLRDFFITIFFVMLGLEMTFANVTHVLVPSFVLALFVIFGKPLIVMAVTGILGFQKRTSFFAGSLLGQVSEFSLILVFLGHQNGIIPTQIVTLLVLVSILSYVGSTYLIQHNNILYRKVSHLLTIFEWKKVHPEHTYSTKEITEDTKDHVVVIGAHQMGQSVIRALEKSGEDVVAVDFNPDIVSTLKEKNVPVIFGDISDSEIQEKIGLHRAKMVISTIPDIEDNTILIRDMNKKNKKAIVVVMAYELSDAKSLYKAGADYVVLPHLAGGRHLAKILFDKKHLELIEEYKEHDLKSWI